MENMMKIFNEYLDRTRCFLTEPLALAASQKHSLYQGRYRF